MTYRITKTQPDLIYREGGNPPVAAGLFIKTETRDRRVAFWPASHRPTPENIELAYLYLILPREDEQPVSRVAIRDFLNAQGAPQ